MRMNRILAVTLLVLLSGCTTALFGPPLCDSGTVAVPWDSDAARPLRELLNDDQNKLLWDATPQTIGKIRAAVNRLRPTPLMTAYICELRTRLGESFLVYVEANSGYPVPGPTPVRVTIFHPEFVASTMYEFSLGNRVQIESIEVQRDASDYGDVIVFHTVASVPYLLGSVKGEHKQVESFAIAPMQYDGEGVALPIGLVHVKSGIDLDPLEF